MGARIYEQWSVVIRNSKKPYLFEYFPGVLFTVKYGSAGGRLVGTNWTIIGLGLVCLLTVWNTKTECCNSRLEKLPREGKSDLLNAGAFPSDRAIIYVVPVSKSLEALGLRSSSVENKWFGSIFYQLGYFGIWQRDALAFMLMTLLRDRLTTVQEFVDEEFVSRVMWPSNRTPIY